MNSSMICQRLKKAEAFDEILDINIDKDEFTSEEYIEK